MKLITQLWSTARRLVFTDENITALLLCLLLLIFIILSADLAPLWIYQGF